MKDTALSRRGFLVGAGLFAGAVAAEAMGATVGASASAEEVEAGGKATQFTLPIEPVTPPESWDEETDVVVCGTGGSGGAAIVGALEAGAKVIGLEKNAIWGGNLQFSGVWGDPLATVPEIAVQNYRLWQTPYAKKNPRVVSILAQRAAEDLNWILSMRQYNFDPYYLQYGCFHPIPADPSIPAEYGGRFFANCLQGRAKALGGDIRYSTPCVALVQEAGGTVVGVKARDLESGREYFIKAKSVVFGVGGWTANRDMLEYYMHEDCSYEITDMCRYMGLPGATGDGARMAKGVGARLMSMNEVDYYDGGVEIPGTPNGPRSFYAGANQLNRQSSLSVNKLGKRFMDESATGGDSFGYQARMKAMQPDATTFTILDSTCITAEQVNAVFMPTACEVPRVWFDDDVKEQIASGIIMKAETPEELAEKMGVPVDTFVATLNEYNAACDAGEDTMFYKPAFYLHALRTPPYYATKGVGNSLMTCLGGVAYDENLNAIRPDGYPIEGLYVCGETASYITGVAKTIQSGRYAGQNAAAHALA